MIAVILRQRNNHFIMAVLGQKKLWSLSKMTIKLWRRRRDLNPRAGFPTYTLSRGASSANLSTSPNIIYEIESVAERQRFELWVLSHH